MDALLQFLVRQKKLASVFTLSVLLVGFYSLQQIQKDRFPNVDFEQMHITTVYPGSSPEDVELNVTNKIEDELKNVSGLDKYISYSREGVSLIYVYINQDAADKEAIKTEVRNAVNRVSDLPREVKSLPTAEDIKISLRSVLQINLVDGEIPYHQLRETANTIKKELELVEGVSSVEKDGFLDREIKIYFKLEKLKQHNISLTQAINEISKHNVRYTAGKSDDYTEEKNIVVIGKYANPKDVGDIVIKSIFEGPVVRVADIAEIVDGYEEEESIIRVNGHKGLILKIKKQEQADIITTVDAVKQRISELNNILPSSMRIFYSDDLSKTVRNRLEIVSANGALGFILVIICLGLFLSVRTAFWVSLSLPITLLGTIFLLNLAGETINLVSLAAMILILGIVVDDSIIIAESIHYYRHQEGHSFNSIVKGVKRVIMPVITTILTTILAFSSMFLMAGTMGKFIYIMPVVVIFGLLLSFLEVTLALPAHLAYSQEKTEKKWFSRIESGFETFIASALRFRYVIVLIFLAILAGSVMLAINSKFVLFPNNGSEKINANVEVKLGSSLNYSDDVIKQVDEMIMRIVGDNLESVSSNIANRFDHITKTEIALTPISERTTDAKALVTTLKEESKKIANVEKINFYTARGGPSQGDDVDIRLVSANDTQRKNSADRLSAILQNINGVYNLDRDDKPGKPRVIIILDNERIHQLNINFSDVTNYLKSTFSGVEVTEVRYGNEDVPFRIYLGSGEKTERNIANLQIANRDNQLINMSEFITLKYATGEPDFNHYNGERSTQVSASVDDKQNTTVSVINQALTELNINENFPEVRTLLEGGSRDTQESLGSFRNAFMMSLIGMFLLLSILFNSYSQPLLILSAVPFSIIGVIWAFFLHQEPISFFSMLGTLALAGVVVNDSLVLVNHLNHVSKHEETGINFKTKDALIWIAKGAKARLRAVVLTSITTLAGILPLAYGLGGRDILLEPMALALGYGLIFATIITLVLLPCLYLINLEIIVLLKRLINRFSHRHSANK